MSLRLLTVFGRDFVKPPSETDLIVSNEDVQKTAAVEKHDGAKHLLPMRIWQPFAKRSAPLQTSQPASEKCRNCIVRAEHFPQTAQRSTAWRPKSRCGRGDGKDQAMKEFRTASRVRPQGLA